MEIVLSKDEQVELVRRAGLSHLRAAESARIVPAYADDMSNSAVATVLGVALKTMRKWRGKFAVKRLAGLQDEGPIGRPKAERGLLRKAS